MTILGTDISSYQAGLRLADLRFAEFVIAKCSQGVGYTDPNYAGWWAEAKHLGRPFGWYHFLSATDGAPQVAHTLACVGDPNLPGMLDVEPYGTSSPGLSHVLAYADAAKSRGLNLRLVYWPHWYWQECGSPDLRPLRDRGLVLVASSYPIRTGNPSQMYPGDAASGWDAYGNVTPGMYQYTSVAPDGGQPLDYNAIRDHSVCDSIFGGSTVSTIPATIGQKWPEIASEFPAGAPYDDSGATIWADGGARAAAYFAKMALAQVTDLKSQVAALTAAINPAALGPQIAAAIDAKALAASIEALMSSTSNPTADAIATTVVAHLAQKLAVTG